MDYGKNIIGGIKAMIIIALVSGIGIGILITGIAFWVLR